MLTKSLGKKIYRRLFILCSLIFTLISGLWFFSNNFESDKDLSAIKKISRALHNQDTTSTQAPVFNSARAESHQSKQGSAGSAEKLSVEELNSQLVKLSESLEKSLASPPVVTKDVIDASRRADLESLTLLNASGDSPSLRFDSSNNILSISGEFLLELDEQTDSSIADAVVGLLENHKAIIGFGENETPSLSGSQSVNSRDELIVRVDRVYKGLPVWGRQLVVTAKDGSVRSIAGKFKAIPADFDTSSRIDNSQLLDIVSNELDSLGSTDLSVESAERGLYLYTNMPIHAYKVRVRQTEERIWDLYIHANTKALIAKTPLFYETVTSSSGIDLLGVRRSFNSFYLQDGSYNLYDFTFPEPDGTYVVDARSLEIASSTARNSGWNFAAVSAIYNAQQSYNYFLDTHARDSFDGQGAQLVAVVNQVDEDGGPWENATWSNGVMRYGSGGGARGWNNIAISRDVAAHEFSHGVVEYSANLVYQNQSGALNESFADFFGAMVDREDWYLGEDLYSSGGYLRSMSDPESAGQPAHMNNFINSPNTPDGDYGGVHYNSGIPNKALYLIAEGLTLEGLGNSIGKEKTELLAYATLLKLSASSEFVDSANTIILEAESIYGKYSSEYIAVTKAWEAVGVTSSEIITEGGVNEYSLETGDDLLVHLYPRDGSIDNLLDEEYDIYVQVVNKPFSGWVESAEIGPINDVPALAATPSVYTSQAGYSYVLYKGNDGKARWAYIANSSEDGFAYEDSEINTVATSNDGNKFAFVFPGSSDIHIYDFNTSSWQKISVFGPSYSTSGEGEAADVVDAISFDTTGQKLIFDFSICRDVPNQEECLTFWSIGIYDFGTDTFQYPFSTANSDFDLGFPKFSNTRNNIISFDYINWADIETEGKADSSVIIYDLENSEILGNYEINGGDTITYAWGISSFVGEDDALVMQMMFDDFASMYQVGLDSDYGYVEGSFTWLMPFDSGFGRAHRNAYKNITATLESNKAAWNLGMQLAGLYGSSEFTVTNNGNREISITSISSSSLALSTDLTNRTLLAGESVTFNIRLDTGKAGLGIFSGSLAIQHSGDNAVLNLGVSANIGIDTDGDGILNSADSDDDNDGVADNLDAFPLDFSESIDTDGDGIGNNSDIDDDGDGVSDNLENARGTNPLLADSDGDGVDDNIDVFPLDETETQDTDGDGIGDNSDADVNGDGILDNDLDGDGYINTADIFPNNGNEWYDTDGDGIGDNADQDYNPAQLYSGFLVNRMHACDGSDDAILSLEVNGQALGGLSSNEILNVSLPSGGHVVTYYVNDTFRLTDTLEVSGNDFYVGWGCSWGDFKFDDIAINYNVRVEGDADADGIFNFVDIDDDNDGIADVYDAFPYQADYHLDSDGDLIPNTWEIRYGLNPNDSSDALSDFDNDSVSAYDEFIAGTTPVGSLDIDGDGQVEALEDGLVILRSMFGFTGNALIDGVISPDSPYGTPPEIKSRMGMLGELLDVDGNGQQDALTDGLLIIRYLFGFRGNELFSGLMPPNTTESDLNNIEDHLEKLVSLLDTDSSGGATDG